VGERLDPVGTVSGWLAAADSVSVLTGAGLSTDSGIPDFRGPQGLWTREPGAERLFDLQAYVSDPELRQTAWRRRLEHPAWEARPNAGHVALVDLERTGRLVAIVTQNIDGLHQAAGSDPARVIELHGTLREVACLSCGRRTPMAEELARVAAGDADPRCRSCAGLLKSATISFGQPLEPSTWRAAVRAARSCALFLAIGSSLQVNPAASLCEVAVASRARLVVINGQPTPYDGLASAALRDPIGTVLPTIVAALLTR